MRNNNSIKSIHEVEPEDALYEEYSDVLSTVQEDEETAGLASRFYSQSYRRRNKLEQNAYRQVFLDTYASNLGID